jgi:hypothetical protein
MRNEFEAEKSSCMWKREAIFLVLLFLLWNKERVSEREREGTNTEAA